MVETHGIFQANSGAGINSFNTGALQGIVSSTLRILKPRWICSFNKGVANSGFIAKACMPVIILRYKIGTERSPVYIEKKKRMLNFVHTYQNYCTDTNTDLIIYFRKFVDL